MKNGIKSKQKNDVKSEVTLFSRDGLNTVKNHIIKTISSREIAKVTGKQHKNVLVDCDNLNESYRNLGMAEISAVNSKAKNGQSYREYNLTQPQMVDLITGYDTEKRIKVNRRWAELELRNIEEEKNPDLIVDRAIRTYKRKGKDDKWIAERLKGKATRNAFTSCLAKHGVQTPEGFKNCTNAIYKPLYGGEGANTIRKKKNLPDTAKIRDNMTKLELSAVEFAENLSEHNIEQKNIHGETLCELECQNSARIVANAIVQSRKPQGVF